MRTRIGLSALLMLSLVASASQNVLQDPGFERYHFDSEKGHYVPDASAVWTEYGFGRASVRFDASDWDVPPAMAAERPLGFTPGARGYEGQGAEENSGRLTFQQDIVDPAILIPAQRYEAWVWLGGSGADDDHTGLDIKEEYGGWVILWYNNVDTHTWTDSTAIETHSAELDFPGAPNGFVRVSGLGHVPIRARGFRFRAAATTMSFRGTSDQGTAVALDNAHFGLVRAPNLLRNGGFEEDVTLGEFAHWQHPADWPFPLHNTNPIKLDRVYSEDVNHPSWLPFMGGWRTYGYDAYLMGWLYDAWSFSQTVDVSIREGGTLVVSFYWLQGMKSINFYQDLERPLGEVDVVLEYLDGETRLDAETFRVGWPFVRNPANTERYDVNAQEAFNGRIEAVPPAGTNRVGLHVRVLHNAVPHAGELYAEVADEFYLGVKDEDQAPTPTPAPYDALVNGDIEEELAGWFTGADAGVTNMPTVNPKNWDGANHSGANTAGVSMMWQGVYSNYMIQPLRVKPGTTYEVGMWAYQYVEDFSTEHARLIVVEGSWPGRERVIAQTLPGRDAPAWTAYTGEYTPVSDTVWVGVRFLGQKTRLEPTGIHVDDVWFREPGTSALRMY